MMQQPDRQQSCLTKILTAVSLPSMSSWTESRIGLLIIALWSVYQNKYPLLTMGWCHHFFFLIVIDKEIYFFSCYLPIYNIYLYWPVDMMTVWARCCWLLCTYVLNVLGLGEGIWSRRMVAPDHRDKIIPQCKLGSPGFGCFNNTMQWHVLLCRWCNEIINYLSHKLH